ncbi:MAG: HK97 family phage prohead protease [Pseudomonadota bacterium]
MFSGYASLFGEPDLGRDLVARGAFQNALRNRPLSHIKMLYQHDPAQPIGVWKTVREDEKGLFVEGQITLESPKGDEVLNLMRSGAVDGLSIGFKTVRSKRDRSSGLRTILEADLWEISVVTFPMLPSARVAQVKSIENRSLPTTREFERWLTQDAGLSRGQARTVIGKGYSALIGKQDAAQIDTATLAAKFRLAAIELSMRNQI